MNHLFVGLTTPEAAAELQRNGHIPGLARARLGSLSALVLPVPTVRFWQSRRRRELEGMVELQRVMEAVIATGPLLAAQPGTRLEDPAEAVSLLAPASVRLEEAFHAFGALRQFQVTVRWDPKAVLAALAERGVFAAPTTDRVEFGKAIRARLLEEKGRLSRFVRDRLAAAARDVVSMPVAEEDVVADAVVLVDAETAALDLELQRIDDVLPGASIVRCVGPLPAVSFAAIRIDRIDDEHVSGARRLLGVKDSAACEDLRSAYVHAARATHPDTGAGVGTEAFAAAREAYNLLSSITGQSGPPAAVRIVREGDTTRRAAA
jgi:hypothetical protein